MKLKKLLLSAGAMAMMAGASSAWAEEITIATVNNNDMIVMQELAPQWEAATGNKINWVVLEENVLRQRTTQDISTNGGSFDIMFIGAYETPIWGKNGWLTSLDDFGDDAAYDLNDIFPLVRSSLSADGHLYAVPLYSETSFTYYRTDLFEKAGIAVPTEQVTYDQFMEMAAKLNDLPRKHGRAAQLCDDVADRLCGMGRWLRRHVHGRHAFKAAQEGLHLSSFVWIVAAMMR
jgi:ABC-type glycerol-3-phosphate transport system substrate-binding protein